MTIGIAATGPDAGRAVRDALGMAETIGSGEIGGFVAFAAIASDGRLLRCETQRGGIAAAMAAAAESSEAILAAPLAAVISSGPDRPAPLSRFLPGDAAAGLVTGHRRPDFPGPDGRPVNAAALDLMREGQDPETAIREALAPIPEIDAGLLAVAPGRIAALDSARVLRRVDRGAALCRSQDGRAAGVVHNSIHPVRGLAEILAEIAFTRLGGPDGAALELRLVPGTPILAGAGDLVEIDGQGTIVRITSSNPHLTAGRRWTSAAVYPGSAVHRDGRRVGTTTGECPALLDDGRVAEVSPPGTIAAVADAAR